MNSREQFSGSLATIELPSAIYSASSTPWATSAPCSSTSPTGRERLPASRRRPTVATFSAVWRGSPFPSPWRLRLVLRAVHSICLSPLGNLGRVLCPLPSLSICLARVAPSSGSPAAPSTSLSSLSSYGQFTATVGTGLVGAGTCDLVIDFAEGGDSREFVRAAGPGVFVAAAPHVGRTSVLVKL